MHIMLHWAQCSLCGNDSLLPVSGSFFWKNYLLSLCENMVVWKTPYSFKQCEKTHVLTKKSHIVHIALDWIHFLSWFERPAWQSFNAYHALVAWAGLEAFFDNFFKLVYLKVDILFCRDIFFFCIYVIFLSTLLLTSVHFLIYSVHFLQNFVHFI